MDLNAFYTKSYQKFVDVTGDILDLNLTQSKKREIGFIDFYEVYRSAEPSELMVYRLMSYIFGTLIFLSNLTVVISSGLILSKGQQQKSTYLLLGNVSLADMIAGISIVFNVGIENPSSGNLLCVFQIGTIVCPAMVSIFSVGLIAVDRYVYILHGMYYHQWINTTKIRISILFMWIVAIILSFLPATGWINNELRYTRCYYVSLFPGTLILLNSLISIVPIVVVAILYSIILVRALRNVKDLKSSVKTLNSDTLEKPEMRIYRGSGNLGKNSLSVKSPPKSTPIKIKENFTFNAYDNKDESKNCAMFGQKSKSEESFINTNDGRFHLDDAANVKSKIKINFHSKTCLFTQSKTLSMPTILVTDVQGNQVIESNSINTVESDTKRRSKTKEPNKWRAITVVMLTSGSFIATWTPFFLTVIFFVFCQEKLTNPKCMKIRMTLEGPLSVLAFLNSILNPLIYAWWHKGFKRSIKTYFQRHVHKYIIKHANR